MKTSLIILLLFTLFNSYSLAQNPFSISVTGKSGIGIDEFGDKYGTGFGGSAALLYSTSRNTDIVLSVGYIKWNNDNLKYRTVPLMVGIRYYIPVSSFKIYIPGFVGVHFTQSEADLPVAIVNGETIGGGTISFDKSFFGFGIGAGILIPVAPGLNIDFNGTYNSISTSETNSNYVGINGGVQFGL